MKFLSTDGTIGKARRPTYTGSDNLSETDVQNSKKLTEIIRNALRRLTAVEANALPDTTEFEVDVTDGSTVSLQHGFQAPVRFYVTSWVPKATLKSYQPPAFSWTQRAMAVGALSTTASNLTVGCSWNIKNQRTITGIRFVWSTALTRTVRCKLWDSSGNLLNSVDVSVSNPGVYEGRFSVPTTVAAGTQVTTSCWDTNGAGGNWSWNNNVTFITNTECGPDIGLVDARLFLAGDAFPTSQTAGAIYMVEPVLSDNSGAQFGVNQASTNSNILVLNSYCTGRAVIRVEPSQYAVKYT